MIPSGGVGGSVATNTPESWGHGVAQFVTYGFYDHGEYQGTVVFGSGVQCLDKILVLCGDYHRWQQSWNSSTNLPVKVFAEWRNNDGPASELGDRVRRPDGPQERNAPRPRPRASCGVRSGCRSRPRPGTRPRPRRRWGSRRGGSSRTSRTRRRTPSSGSWTGPRPGPTSSGRSLRSWHPATSASSRTWPSAPASVRRTSRCTTPSTATTSTWGPPCSAPRRTATSCSRSRTSRRRAESGTPPAPRSPRAPVTRPVAASYDSRGFAPVSREIAVGIGIGPPTPTTAPHHASHHRAHRQPVVGGLVCTGGVDLREHVDAGSRARVHDII